MHTGQFSFAIAIRCINGMLWLQQRIHFTSPCQMFVEWENAYGRKNKWQIIYCDWFVLNVLSFFFFSNESPPIESIDVFRWEFLLNFHSQRILLYFFTLFLFTDSFFSIQFVIVFLFQIMYLNFKETAWWLIKRNFILLLQFEWVSFQFDWNHTKHTFITQNHIKVNLFLLRRVWLGSIMTFFQLLD